MKSSSSFAGSSIWPNDCLYYFKRISLVPLIQNIMLSFAMWHINAEEILAFMNQYALLNLLVDCGTVMTKGNALML